MTDAGDVPEWRITWDDELGSFVILKMTWVGKHSTKPRLVDVEIVDVLEHSADFLVDALAAWLEQGAVVDESLELTIRHHDDGSHEYAFWVPSQPVEPVQMLGPDEWGDEPITAYLEENVPAPQEHGFIRAGNLEIAWLVCRWWNVT